MRSVLSCVVGKCVIVVGCQQKLRIQFLESWLGSQLFFADYIEFQRNYAYNKSISKSDRRGCI